MATQFRIDRGHAFVASHEAARRLVRRVNVEILEGAYIILSEGKYTTGKLRLGLKRREEDTPQGVRGRVGISKREFPYAASVEGGARRHPIPHEDNHTAKILKFYWRKVGHIVYFSEVDHPGQRGKAYLRRPLARAAARHNLVVVTYDA